VHENNKTMKTQKLNTVMEFLADMVYTIALSLSATITLSLIIF